MKAFKCEYCGKETNNRRDHINEECFSPSGKHEWRSGGDYMRGDTGWSDSLLGRVINRYWKQIGLTIIIIYILQWLGIDVLGYISKLLE